MNVELRVDGEVVIRMEVNTNLMSQLLYMEAKTSLKSTPLTKVQAEALLARLDEKIVRFLKKIAANDGWITWGEIKQQFGIHDWSAFKSGPGNEINRALRDILHKRSPRLVWRDDYEWKGVEEGEDEVCKAYVDGAALVALREASGVAM
jgi:hypothetical protein